MSIVSLSDAKTFLNMETTSKDDGELQDMLDRAEAVLARRIGPLGPQTVTDEVHTGPGPLVLRVFPVQSVTSISDSGTVVTGWDVDTDAGVVYGWFSRYPRNVKVTYLAGRQTLPADLVEAVLELVRHLWKSQRGGGSNRPNFPGEGDPNAAVGEGYLLPYRVQSLIEPYLIKTVA